MSTVLVKPEELSHEGAALVAAAKAFTVVDNAAYAEAGERRKLVRAYLARVDEVMGPIVDAAYAAHKVAVRQRDLLKRPATEADEIYKARRLAYEDEQARKRRAQEEAEHEERERLEREAREQAAALQRRLMAEEEESRLNAAVAAEQRGDTQAAERILSVPAAVPVVMATPVVMPPSLRQEPPPQVEGITARMEWDFEVTEPVRVPREYLTVDEKAIRAVVRALKDKTRIPGVRVFPRRNEAVRL